MKINKLFLLGVSLLAINQAAYCYQPSFTKVKIALPTGTKINLHGVQSQNAILLSDDNFYFLSTTSEQVQGSLTIPLEYIQSGASPHPGLQASCIATIVIPLNVTLKEVSLDTKPVVADYIPYNPGYKCTDITQTTANISGDTTNGYVITFN